MTSECSLLDPPLAFGATESRPLCRSTQISKPPDSYCFSLSLFLDGHLVFYFCTNLYSQSQAVQHECWKKAMQDELNALTQNHAWDIVQYLDSIKHMDASWFML